MFAFGCSSCGLVGKTNPGRNNGGESASPLRQLDTRLKDVTYVYKVDSTTQLHYEVRIQSESQSCNERDFGLTHFNMCINEGQY